MKRSTLNEEQIALAIADGYWRVKTFSEVDSTQDVIRLSNPVHGDVVVADFQKKGRGRLDRKFDSVPEAGLLFSLFLQPKIDKELWGVLPLLVGMTVAHTLNENSQSHIFTTKWPNDILGPNGKIAGILCESFNDGVIVGTGINVNTTKEHLPVPTATSLLLECGEVQDRTELLIRHLHNLRTTFEAWSNGTDVISLYRASNSTLGRKVKVTLPDGNELISVALDIQPNGALTLESGHAVTVGDVVHLR